MPNHELLNNNDHKDIKIISERSAEYGDDIWTAPIFPGEFRSVQAHYPILLQKNSDTGELIPLAFFGFQKGENLFLNNGRWEANYIPISIQRLPFHIGFQKSAEAASTEARRMITIDMDSPRVNKETGNSLFLEFGGNSDYLERIASMLETLHQGLQENVHFEQMLTELDLIEPVTLDIELIDGSKNKMIGFHTINEDKLNALSDDNIIKLHKAGFLQAIYLMIASQVHFRELVERKNRQLVV